MAGKRFDRSISAAAIGMSPGASSIAAAPATFAVV
jgi:hypothetical protein